MPTAEARTVGEIGRKLDEVVQGQAEILRRLELLDERYVPREVAELTWKSVQQENDVLSGRVAALESWRDWVLRTVLAFVILGILGGVFAVTRAGGAG